jgi:hypothetical protein
VVEPWPLNDRHFQNEFGLRYYLQGSAGEHALIGQYFVDQMAPISNEGVDPQLERCCRGSCDAAKYVPH